MNSLFAIIGLFAVGALIGIYLLTLVLQNKETSKLIAFMHGALVASALVMLIIYTINHIPSPIESLVFFVMAALGGFVLIYRDLTGKPIPKWLAVTHGLLALAGFIFLIIFTFT